MQICSWTCGNQANSTLHHSTVVDSLSLESCLAFSLTAEVPHVQPSVHIDTGWYGPLRFKLRWPRQDRHRSSPYATTQGTPDQPMFGGKLSQSKALGLSTLRICWFRHLGYVQVPDNPPPLGAAPDPQPHRPHCHLQYCPVLRK